MDCVSYNVPGSAPDTTAGRTSLDDLMPVIVWLIFVAIFLLGDSYSRRRGLSTHLESYHDTGAVQRMDWRKHFEAVTDPSKLLPALESSEHARQSAAASRLSALVWHQL